MAICSDHDTAPIYEVARVFRDRCLLADGSLIFDDASFWTIPNLEALHKAFVGAPDESDRSFEEKFWDQIKPGGPDVIRLAADVMAIYLLFPSNVGGPRKRELIAGILELSGDRDRFTESHPVSIAFGDGVGSGGQGYNTRRRFELYFLIEFALAWKKLLPEEANERAHDPWKFMDFLDTIDGAEGAQLRHILLHLLFPEHFERIASGNHKRRIDATFGTLAEDEAQKQNLDRRLYAVRRQLEKLRPGEELDFYSPPLSNAWYDDSEAAGGVVPLEAILHKRQIILYGPPGTGKTHRAKAIAEQLIRSSALQRWGAPRYFKDAAALEKLIYSHVRRLQLHPAYSYEDFIRGLHILGDGRTEYRAGYLLNLITEIEKEPQGERLPYVLILDEINRTDLSRLLGECFSLLENRGDTIDLPGSFDGKPMTIRMPGDLYVIGTMNLIDQSIEQIDFALRRRFLWVDCPFSAHELLHITEQLWSKDPPPYHEWDRVRDEFARLAASATALNTAIRDSQLLGAQYEIGHTYFFDVVYFLRRELEEAQRWRKYLLWRHGQPMSPLIQLWSLALRPLLREYLSGLDANARQAEIARLEGTFFQRPEPLGDLG